MGLKILISVTNGTQAVFMTNAGQVLFDSSDRLASEGRRRVNNAVYWAAFTSDVVYIFVL
jgi:hypothetical protein